MQKHLAYFIIGLMFFGFAAYNIYLWIKSSLGKPFQQAIKEYLRKFPEVIQNGQIITFLNILFLSAALLFFYKAQHEKRLKVLALSFFGISLMLVCWNIFSLM